MTIQEMFDKAYIGLASQGFEQCKAIRAAGVYFSSCAYSDGKGKHCAWGWVDLSLSETQLGSVEDLNRMGIGIASTLDEKQLEFALKLQHTHDSGAEPWMMKNSLAYLALHYNLEMPK